MEIMLHLINGMALGIEYVPQVDEEDPDVRCVVVDIFIVRLMCFF
jgi:hypothetical protein